MPPAPLVAPQTLREVRAYCYWSACYLTRLLDTTYLPHADHIQIIIRECQTLALLLPSEPTPRVET